jgi:proteic killer suppression protein
VIKSWGNGQAKEVFLGLSPKTVPADIFKRARRLLAQLNAAASVDDMVAPPSNRLHKLRGDMEGYWSVSVKMQFRVTFKWAPEGPEEVWLGGYH